MHNPIHSLRMEHITKTFPGTLACDDVTIDIGKGEILALVGENGAGKTTLMNILMGLYRADSGRILINGEPVIFNSPNDAFSHGLGMVHQQYMLVPNMTVTENVALGYKKAWNPLKLDLEIVRNRIMEISDKYGLLVDPDAYIWQLSVGEQQRIELVKTLCLGAGFLILDEPTSALTPQETDELIVLLRKMANELSIIFISHKLDEVKKLSDRVTILRHGKVVFNGNTADYSPEKIAALMTGHQIKMPVNTSGENNNPAALEISHIKVKSDRGFYALNDLSLTIKEGEIMGLAGVSGNGQKELAEAINGLRKVESGTISLLGEDITNKRCRQIISLGNGYIPEERNIEGIVPSFSVKENLILKDSDDKRYHKGPFLDHKAIEKYAQQMKEKFDIRCPDINVAAGSLSGGNIQKVILARELDRDPKFLIAVYPIRGLDLGAVQFIHEQLIEIRNKGLGILLISEELEEIQQLSDRVAIIYEGEIRAVLPQKEATNSRLGILMAGVQQ